MSLVADKLNTAPKQKRLASTPDGIVGEKIRARRKIRRVSLEQLAAEVQASTGLLSQIERGLTSPSLEMLRRIAAALGMPLSWLFGEDNLARPDADIVVRHADRRKLEFDDIGMVKELLTHDAEGVLQVVMMTLKPGGRSSDEPLSFEGEVAGLVLSGEIELMIKARTILIGEKDSFRFKGDQGCQWRNPSQQQDTEVLIVVTPPFY